MATKANINIDQGSTFSTDIVLADKNGTVLDLTGYTGEAQLRKHYTSSTAVDFDVTINATAGQITLGLSANTTNNIVDGRYVYDVEITDSSNVISRILEGIVTVTPGVTR